MKLFLIGGLVLAASVALTPVALAATAPSVTVVSCVDATAALTSAQAALKVKVDAAAAVQTSLDQAKFLLAQAVASAKPYFQSQIDTLTPQVATAVAAVAAVQAQVDAAVKVKMAACVPAATPTATPAPTSTVAPTVAPTSSTTVPPVPTLPPVVSGGVVDRVPTGSVDTGWV